MKKFILSVSILAIATGCTSNSKLSQYHELKKKKDIACSAFEFNNIEIQKACNIIQPSKPKVSQYIKTSESIKQCKSVIENDLVRKLKGLEIAYNLGELSRSEFEFYMKTIGAKSKKEYDNCTKLKHIEHPKWVEYRSNIEKYQVAKTECSNAHEKLIDNNKKCSVLGPKVDQAKKDSSYTMHYLTSTKNVDGKGLIGKTLLAPIVLPITLIVDLVK